MKIWLPRIWLGLLLALLLFSIPQCLNMGSEEHSLMNWDGQQSTFDPKGPLAEQQIHVFYITLAVTTLLFITVGGTYAIALVKFRARKTDDPNFRPKQSHGNPLVEVGLVAVSAGLLVIIAIPTFAGIVMIHKVPKELEREGVVHVNVTGYQWWFNFEYSDEGFYSSNELVIPVGKPVKLNLVTNDVIHSFWLPKLSGKMDLVAGQENKLWIMGDEEGYYWGQCAEYCGDSHAYMLFRARVLSVDDYEQWVDEQKMKTVDPSKGFAPVHIPSESDPELVAKGTEVFSQHCVRCHSVDSGSQTSGAPNLSHFASRSSIAAGWYENSWVGPSDNPNLYEWIMDPESVKPGSNMWRGFMMEDGKSVQMAGLNHAELTPDQVTAVIAYLYTLRAPGAEPVDAIKYAKGL